MRKINTWMCVCLILVISHSFISCKKRSINEDKTIKIALNRNEQAKGWVSFGISFNEEKIAPTLKERPVKASTDLLKNCKVGLTYDGTYVLLRRQQPENVLELIVDTNCDNDLSDEKVLTLSPEGSVIVNILRKYDKSHEVWLPYKISHREYKKEDRLDMTSGYRMEGMLEYKGREYLITLTDMDCNGKFDNDYRYGTNFSIDLNGDAKIWGSNEYYKSRELIPVGDDFFEVLKIKEDGSSLTLVKSELKHVKIGELAPDFELEDNTGRTFHISDLRGKVVVMNFWTSWCKPCIEKFPKLKELYDKYRSEEIEFIGMNADTTSGLKRAFELIKEYEFEWPQVMLGDPDYSPVWRSYSRITDHSSYLSLTVVIDKDGKVVYANPGGKQLEEVYPVLEKLLVKRK